MTRSILASALAGFVMSSAAGAALAQGPAQGQGYAAPTASRARSW
jgi:hypothetical protein